MTVAILTAIAALCVGDRQCIERTNQCVASHHELALSEQNVCQKTLFLARCKLKFDESATVLQCWKAESRLLDIERVQVPNIQPWQLDPPGECAP